MHFSFFILAESGTCRGRFSGRFFDAYRALLEVGLARNGIERALRDLVGVGFSEVERKKYLSRSDDFSYAKLNAADTAARGDDFHAVVRLEVEAPGIGGIHFE